MTTIAEIEQAIERLPLSQAREIAAWIEEYLADQWDAQIEADAQSGKLDFLLEKADQAHESGNVRPFHP